MHTHLQPTNRKPLLLSNHTILIERILLESLKSLLLKYHRPQELPSNSSYTLLFARKYRMKQN